MHVSRKVTFSKVFWRLFKKRQCRLNPENSTDEKKFHILQ